MIAKLCSSCGLEKSETLFGKDKRTSTGLKSACRECTNALSRQWRKDNPEAAKDAERRKRRDPVSERLRKAKYPIANPERAKASKKAWLLNNKERMLSIRREWGRKKRSTPKGKIECAISRGILRGLKDSSKAGRHTFDLLGYGVDDIQRHLERQFRPGMTWDNYGRGGWSVDHIVPLAAFNYSTPDDLDFKRAWALDNLQPLWESENSAKGDRLFGEFQPCLALAA